MSKPRFVWAGDCLVKVNAISLVSVRYDDKGDMEGSTVHTFDQHAVLLAPGDTITLLETLDPYIIGN